MIAFTSISLDSNRNWLLSWASTGASFYRIVLWGVEIARTTVTSYTYPVHGQTNSTFPPPLEIASEDELVLSEEYLPYLVMQWYGEATAQRYRVEQQISGVWTAINEQQEVGSWIYTYQTTRLLDTTTYSFRVTAYDSYGNPSTPRQYSRYVVCPPVPPDGTISIKYNKPNLVISNV